MTARTDALAYLAEARKLAALPIPMRPVEWVQLKAMLEAAEASVQAIEELQRKRRAKKAVP